MLSRKCIVVSFAQYRKGIMLVCIIHELNLDFKCKAMLPIAVMTEDQQGHARFIMFIFKAWWVSFYVNCISEIMMFEKVPNTPLMNVPKAIQSI